MIFIGSNLASTLTEKISQKRVTNTFARRSTVIPGTIPGPFTEEFSSDAQKIAQWSAFSP